MKEGNGKGEWVSRRNEVGETKVVGSRRTEVGETERRSEQEGWSIEEAGVKEMGGYTWRTKEMGKR